MPIKIAYMRRRMRDFNLILFEWWAGLTPLVRYGIAFAFLLVGTILCYFTDGGYLTWGSFLVTGIVLLMFAGRSQGE